MDAFVYQTEPTWVVLSSGQRIPLMFSMRAAARMEKELGKPYPQILDELFGKEAERQGLTPAMSWERQACLIACLADAAGLAVTPEALMDLHLQDFSLLCQGAVQEILFKSPQDSKKK